MKPAAARAFAIEAHGKQRYGDVPYVVHLDDVARTAVRFQANENVVIGAFLHDVLEDTGADRKQMQDRFGTDVFKIVEAVTRKPDERETSYARRIRAAGPDAVALKLADRIANVEACLRDPVRWADKLERYRDEHALIAPIVKKAGEHDAMWKHLEGLLKR